MLYPKATERFQAMIRLVWRLGHGPANPNPALDLRTQTRSKMGMGTARRSAVRFRAIIERLQPLGMETFFVSTNILNFRHLLQSERSASLFIECLYLYRSEERYLLHEFVVMPNHVHLIVSPRGVTIERVVGMIKGGFSFRAKEQFGWKGPTWIRSFQDRRLRDAEEYAVRKTYVWENPVRAGLCARPEDWPYGSACGRFELDPVPQRLKPLAMGRGTHG